MPRINSLVLMDVEVNLQVDALGQLWFLWMSGSPSLSGCPLQMFTKTHVLMDAHPDICVGGPPPLWNHFTAGHWLQTGHHLLTSEVNCTSQQPHAHHQKYKRRAAPCASLSELLFHATARRAEVVAIILRRRVTAGRNAWGASERRVSSKLPGEQGEYPVNVHVTVHK